jgi:hypothetical protein
MEQVKMYKTNDGRLFATEQEAVEHEAKLKSVKELYKLLKPIPENDGCRFANGHGFVQQDPIAVQEFKRKVMLMGAAHHEKMVEWAKNPIDVHPQSIVGRILSDCDSVLYKAWSRVMCMDDKYREWGQPYYALNPDEGEQVEVAA